MNNVIPKIKSIFPTDDLFLIVEFDDGKKVRYDVNTDIKEIPSYSLLSNVLFFRQAHLDESRTCVYWNGDIDLPSDSIYEYGTTL